jgi:hypothetical protein
MVSDRQPTGATVRRTGIFGDYNPRANHHDLKIITNAGTILAEYLDIGQSGGPANHPVRCYHVKIMNRVANVPIQIISDV